MLTCIFTKINISFILESTGIQQVSLDSTKTALPYEGGLVAYQLINILFILESTGIQQVSLDSTKTALPYEGGLVAYQPQA